MRETDTETRRIYAATNFLENKLENEYFFLSIFYRVLGQAKTHPGLCSADDDDNFTVTENKLLISSDTPFVPRVS